MVNCVTFFSFCSFFISSSSPSSISSSSLKSSSLCTNEDEQVELDTSGTLWWNEHEWRELEKLFLRLLLPLLLPFRELDSPWSSFSCSDDSTMVIGTSGISLVPAKWKQYDADDDDQHEFSPTLHVLFGNTDVNSLVTGANSIASRRISFSLSFFLSHTHTHTHHTHTHFKQTVQLSKWEEKEKSIHKILDEWNSKSEVE